MKTQKSLIVVLVSLLMAQGAFAQKGDDAPVDDQPEGTNSTISPTPLLIRVRSLPAELSVLLERTSVNAMHAKKARRRIAFKLRSILDSDGIAPTQLIIRYISNRALEIDELVGESEDHETNALMAGFLRDSIALAIHFKDYDIEAAGGDPSQQHVGFEDFAATYTAFLMDFSLRMFRNLPLEYELARKALGYIYNDLQSEPTAHPAEWSRLIFEIQYLQEEGGLPEDANLNNHDPRSLLIRLTGIRSFYEGTVVPIFDQAVSGYREPLAQLQQNAAPSNNGLFGGMELVEVKANGTYVVQSNEREINFSSTNYASMINSNWSYRYPSEIAGEMRLFFSKFSTESGYDRLKFASQSYEGEKGAFWSQWFSGNSVYISFEGDTGGTRQGIHMERYQWRSPEGIIVEVLLAN